MTTRPPVLFLDVMDTLVEDPFFTRVPAFFAMSMEELLAVKDPTAWLDFERGLVDEEEYARRAFKDGRAYDHAAFRALMVDGYRYLEGVEDLLAQLKSRGVEMHALSNYPPWFELLDEKLRLSRYLSWRFVSCKTGVRKPDPGAYTGPLTALERAPGECWFIDDRRVNCEVAEALSIRTHHFTGVAGLRSFLEVEGLL